MKKKTGIVLFILMAAFAVGASAQAAADYKSKCAMCHAADGSASTGAGKAMQVPPTTSPAFAKASDAELFAILKNGKGKMPAYAGKLTDAQMKELITYMRSLK